MACAAVAVVLAAPTSAAVASPPAVDQYTQHLPTADDGSQPAGETAPVAQLEQLPSETVADLSGPDGELLAQIATSPDLGAPQSTESSEQGAGASTRTSGNGRGLATVVADTASTGPSLALAGALIGIAFAGAWNRFFRRRPPSAGL